MDYSFIIISFLFGGIVFMACNSIYKKVLEMNSITNINALYSEILFSISKSKFVTRVNNNVTVECATGTLGVFSLLYMIDRDDIAVFKDGKCIYTTENVRDDLVQGIVKKINNQHKKEINDVVSIFGFTFSRIDFETKFKMKIENGMLYPLDKKEEESDVDKIVNKNSEMFNMDEILDKINNVGIDNLSVEEKAFLKSFKS